MDPDETQMFVEAYWWRWEMEDRKQAHYTSMQLVAAGVKKDKVKPSKIKFLSEWQGDSGASPDDVPELEGEEEPASKAPKANKPSSKKRSAEDEKAAFKRLKEYSKQRAREHRGG